MLFRLNSFCYRCSQLQVQELQSLGFGPKEGSLQALFQHGGDVARALTELQRQRLEPFHQRLWDRGPEPTPCWDGLDKQVLRVSHLKEQEKMGEDPWGLTATVSPAESLCRASSDDFWQSTHSPAGVEQSWHWRCCRRRPGTMSYWTWWRL